MLSRQRTAAILLLLLFLLAPAAASLKIEPASAKLTASNTSSTTFDITIIPEAGEEGKAVTLYAEWPAESEISWTSRRIAVGQKGFASLRLTPRTGGDRYLRVRLEGDGVLPQEEYVHVVVTSQADYASLGSEISGYRRRVNSLSGRAASLGSPGISARVSSLNQTLFVSETAFSEGKYSLANSTLSVVRTDLPEMEAEVASQRTSKGFFLDSLPFITPWADSVSLDLAILIFLLAVAIIFAAKSILF